MLDEAHLCNLILDETLERIIALAERYDYEVRCSILR